MKNKYLIITLFLSCFFSCIYISGTYAQTGYKIKPAIEYYDGLTIVDEYSLDLKDKSVITDKNGSEWLLNVNKSKVKGQPGATDYKLTWTLAKGNAKGAVVRVKFLFGQWSSDNFVFVPSAVYNGNKFDTKNMPYPPYWYSKDEWRLDMPTTFNEAPTLGKNKEHGLIELNTGSAATPLMAFHSPEKQEAWIILTTQGSQFGEHGLFIEEDNVRNEAEFSISAPAIRKKPVRGGGDVAPDWKTGDSVSIHFRVYKFKAPKLNDMYQKFSMVRKELNPSERNEVLPFSEAWNLLNNLYQTERWDNNANIYWLSKVGRNTSWNHIWQLGWVGGGQATLPLMMQGNKEVQKRTFDNIDVIFSKTQAPSGFFNAYGNGVEFKSFGYGTAFKLNETFVRSQGDWLYMSQLQINWLKSHGYTIPQYWLTGLKKQADAFMRLWDKYGQFGQFVDVVTGDICIGGSTAGAIVPGGLALASLTFDNPVYLETAKRAGRKYYNDYVVKGYTTGGPGEILSAPDSESAFALFESFMVLYELTNDKEWLEYASELLPICESWTVSYDFKFPEKSILGGIDTRSRGAVWASIGNMHGAPGICTWSGDCLLKYYRATDNIRALNLLADIAHGLPQYISRADRPIGNMPPGGICERVNLSDWEGKRNVGGNIFASCSWCEVAGLLTVTQLPGIYVQPDKKFYMVFDNIKAEEVKSKGKGMTLRLTNPTKFPAEVKLYAESSETAKKELFRINSEKVRIVRLEPNESKEITF